MNKREQLEKMTVIVADTGDIEAIKKYVPTDATTNPSLILAAIQNPKYEHLIKEAVDYAKKNSAASDVMPLLMDKIFVNFGAEILKTIPGRVSTEVDARLSFDVEGSIVKAKKLIELYKEMGIDKERVLIKLASTWEGGLAARQLEADGIHCNMTLLFSLAQAAHCAESKATLISPFVGRILDWYKKSENVEGYPAPQDPGVLSVREIYLYFKKYGYPTQVMGASFRNVDEILELAGCDLLTISPNFLEDLAKSEGKVERKLDPKLANECTQPQLKLNESQFRLMLNDNAMATEKLSEGIRNFAKDAIKLEKILKEKFHI